MPGGRPRKRQKNISGLRNQQITVPNNTGEVLALSGETDDTSDGSEWQLHRVHDSLKPDFAQDDADSDVEEESDWEDLDNEEATHKMVELIVELERKCPDEEWVPPEVLRQLRKNKARRRVRPTVYKTGPDVGSKAPRTQRRYKWWHMQTNLDGFVQSIPSAKATSAAPGPSTDVVQGESAMISDQGLEELGSVEAEDDGDLEEDDTMQDISGDEEDLEDDQDEGSGPRVEVVLDEDDWEDEESEGMELEEEIMDQMQGGAPVRDWTALRKKINDHLKKKHDQLTLSQINQLTVLRNFATLRLKGYKRIPASLEIARQWKDGDGVWFARRVRALARHYQVFEELPMDIRKRALTDPRLELLNVLVCLVPT